MLKTGGNINQGRVLPVIDISPWLDADKVDTNGGRQATSAAIHAACLTYGFFYLDISSLVDPAETDELISLAHEFFSLPEETKDQYALRYEDGARGYARLRENVTNGKGDQHEGIDFYAPVPKPDKTKPLWGQNQWPKVGGFREKYEKWTEKMKMLGVVVMEAMAAGLGMRTDEWKELFSQINNSFWCMRIIGYPPLPDGYDGYSCGSHKDYGCLTFLYADSTRNALQVFLPQEPDILPTPAFPTDLTSKGGPGISENGIWINADPIPGCVVCNIGEMWEIWTNGLYKSTLHRVIHMGSNYRVSVPFFFEPNFDARISPLAAALRLQTVSNGTHKSNEKTNDAEIVRPANAEYKSVTYGEFLLKKVISNFDSTKGKYS